MAYTLNTSNGCVLVTLDDGTVNSTVCSLTLIGRNVGTYGERQNENFIKLLENFNNSSSPAAPLSGQLWYDNANEQLKVYLTDSWEGISTYTKSNSAPGNLNTGDLWYDTTAGQVKIKVGGNYILLGPISANGGNSTITEETFTDVSSNTHKVLGYYVDGTRMAVFSNDAQYSTTANVYPGFTTVKPGMNLSTTVSNAVFNGLATNSQALNGLSSSQFMRSDDNTGTTGNLSVIGNISSGNITVGNGSFYYGDGGRLSNVAASNVSGYVSNAVVSNVAVKLETARNISLGGNLTGSASFDGSVDVTITATLAEERLKLSGGTMSGQLNAAAGFTASGNLIYTNSGKVGINTSSPAVALDVKGAVRSAVQLNGSTSGATTLDGQYSNHQINLTGAVTLSFTNFSDNGQIMRVILVNTQNSVSWPGTVYWPNGATPNLQNGPNKIAVVTLIQPYGVSNHLASYVCY
jgi:hypothetical protein